MNITLHIRVDQVSHGPLPILYQYSLFVIDDDNNDHSTYVCFVVHSTLKTTKQKEKI
jgi:hypothetical protein